MRPSTSRLPVTVCTPGKAAVQVAPVHPPSGVIVNVVRLVTSPVGLPNASTPVAVYSRDRPAVIGPAGVTVRAAVAAATTSSVTDPRTVPPVSCTVPVTVRAPARVALQRPSEQEPSGSMSKVVTAVRSPVGLPNASSPTAWKERLSPAVRSPAGPTVRVDGGPAATVSGTEPVTSRSPTATVAVTVCEPARVAVHAAPSHEPSGAILTTASSVRSTTGLPPASSPPMVKVTSSPAVRVAPAGMSRSPLTSGMARRLACPLTSRAPRSTAAVTVWSPTAVGVQVAPSHAPSGPTVKCAQAVRSTTGRPTASNPVVV